MKGKSKSKVSIFFTPNLVMKADRIDEVGVQQYTNSEGQVNAPEFRVNWSTIPEANLDWALKSLVSINFVDQEQADALRAEYDSAKQMYEQNPIPRDQDYY